MAPFDPELDTMTRPAAAPAGDVADYQRLLANPLLAVIALLGVWALFRYSLESRNLALFLATIFAGAVSTLLIQYHCLDCGRTDFALRSRKHACAAVVHRRRLDEEAPLLPPSLRGQVKAWVLASILAGLLYAIFRHHS